MHKTVGNAFLANAGPACTHSVGKQVPAISILREASGAGGGAGSVGLLAMNATQVQCEPHDSVVLIK